MEKYSKIKVLGHGAFGKAWLVSDNVSLQAFVIKEISIPVLKERDKQQAINEVKILATLKHKNIISYKEAFVHEKCLCICMEYANDGDLAEKIKKQSGRLFMELQIIDWFVQILIAVKYIHGLNILHRDLKSQNIFLTSDGFVKIGDFGVSRCLDGGLEQAKTAIGTPYYLSPEICQQKSYDHKSDMWSLGVLIYELATLKHPFVANDFQNLIVKIVKGKYPPIPGCFGPLVQDLVLILLQVSPEHRPSASQLLKAPSLQQHVRSYLLRVRNMGRSALTERTKSASIERLEEIKPVSSRLKKTNSQENSIANESYCWQASHCSNQRLQLQSQTDSAYASDNDQTSDSGATGHSLSWKHQAGPIDKYKNVVDQISNEIIMKNVSDRDLEQQQEEIPVFVRRRVPPTEKRQSYLEAIASTDQSMIGSDLNRTYENIPTKTDHNGASKVDRNSKGELSKEGKLKALRRRSLDVENLTRTSSKSKLPRRLSMDSIGNQSEADETIKPKRRSSFSTLKKFIRRNSKSTDDDAKKSTNDSSSKIPSPNQGAANSHVTTATTPNREHKTKQSKCSVNFIERNKKLAETPKSKAPKKGSERSEKQDKKGKPKKLASLSEAPEESTKTAPNPSLLSTYIIRNDKAVDFPPQPIPRAPLLRKRSMTFDHKETFLKFGQNDVNKSDATELDCIGVGVVGATLQPMSPKSVLQDPSNTELKKKEKKKVRHQSSNVFPDGFRVKETVKQRIMGRLRAASHSSGDNNNKDKTKKSSDGQNKSSSAKLLQPSKTYTVLNALPEQSRDQNNSNSSKMEEALKIIKQVKVSQEDLELLRRACVLVEGDKDNVLLKLLEMSL